MIKPNIYNEDALAGGFDDMQFDVVLANPPYQEIGKPRHKLWTRFVEWSLSVSDKVAFVTPKMASQLLNGHEVDHVTLKDYSVAYYNGYNVEKHFKGVGSDFCYFILDKNYLRKEFIMVTSNGEEKWKTGSHISYDTSPIISSIISKTMNFKNDYGRSAARVEENEMGDFKAIRKITKEGPVWVKTASTHKDTNKIKMLYPTLGHGYYLDTKGEVMPSTSFVPYITVNSKKELNDLTELQESVIFKFLMNVYSSMRSPRDYVWKNIKKGEFELSKEELEYIHGAKS